jgi:hypothetical protein
MGLLLVPAVADAQQRAGTGGVGFDAGEWTLRLGGTGSSSNDFDFSSFSIEATVGHFFTDNLALELDQGFGFVDAPGGTDWFASTRIGPVYYFDLERWQPFLGGNIGAIYGDAVRNQFIAGLKGGVAYFVNTTTFVYGSLEYQFLFRSARGVSDNFDDGRFVYTLGVGFTF